MVEVFIINIQSFIYFNKTFQLFLLGLPFGAGVVMVNLFCATTFVHVLQHLEQDVLCQIAGGLSLVPLTAIIPPPSI